MTAIATKQYRAQVRDKADDLLTLKTVLQELAQTNTSLLYDLLYGDLYDDLFKPSEKVEDIQHPLVNHSLFLIPEIHTFETNPSVYVTIPLTTTSPKLPPTTTPEPTRTTSVTTHPTVPPFSPSTAISIVVARMLQSTTSGRGYLGDQTDTNLLSTQSELRSGKEDELAPDQNYYNSYDEDELSTTTTGRPILRESLPIPRHHHKRRHHKRRRPRLSRTHKMHSGRGRGRGRGHGRERQRDMYISSGKHRGFPLINDMDEDTEEADYDEDESYHNPFKFE